MQKQGEASPPKPTRHAAMSDLDGRVVVLGADVMVDSAHPPRYGFKVVLLGLVYLHESCL